MTFDETERNRVKKVKRTQYTLKKTLVWKFWCWRSISCDVWSVGKWILSRTGWISKEKRALAGVCVFYRQTHDDVDDADDTIKIIKKCCVKVVPPFVICIVSSQVGSVGCLLFIHDVFCSLLCYPTEDSAEDIKRSLSRPFVNKMTHQIFAISVHSHVSINILLNTYWIYCIYSTSIDISRAVNKRNTDT